MTATDARSGGIRVQKRLKRTGNNLVQCDGGVLGVVVDHPLVGVRGTMELKVAVSSVPLIKGVLAVGFSLHHR